MMMEGRVEKCIGGFLERKLVGYSAIVN